MDPCTCLHHQGRAIRTPPTPAKQAAAADATPTAAWAGTPAATSICENTVATLKCLAEDRDGVVRSIRDAPPSHYTFKIQSFSTFSNNSIDKHDSLDFEVGDYKWKLSLYPNGSKNTEAKDYLSLYLGISQTTSLPANWEVNAIFRLFVYDQIRDKYLTVQDANGRPRRFRGSKTEWGFDQFIPLSIFNDPSAGYLIDDTCVFGAEIFLIKSTGKGEDLSLIKNATVCRHTWKIQRFSRLAEESYFSEVFIAEDYEWNIKLYPKGFSKWKGYSLSIFLFLADTATISSDQQVYLKYCVRVVDQTHGEHIERKGSRWFSASSTNWGWWNFMRLIDLNDQTRDFLGKDTCIIEAEVSVLGVVDKLS